MNMKATRITTLLALLLMIFGGKAFGQENYLWPIPGKQAGDDILYRPQDYIGVAEFWNSCNWSTLGNTRALSA